MLEAITSAREGMRKGEGGPFGACIVCKTKVLAVTHNTVLKNKDATCHAEINAIRMASQKLGSYDLSECEIYSTTEPCPMCFSAIHWARIRTIYFGTRIKDVQKRGFNELAVSTSVLKRWGKSKVTLKPDFMKRECQKLLKCWDQLKLKKIY